MTIVACLLLRRCGTPASQPRRRSPSCFFSSPASPVLNVTCRRTCFQPSLALMRAFDQARQAKEPLLAVSEPGNHHSAMGSQSYARRSYRSWVLIIVSLIGLTMLWRQNLHSKRGSRARPDDIFNRTLGVKALACNNHRRWTKGANSFSATLLYLFPSEQINATVCCSLHHSQSGTSNGLMVSLSKALIPKPRQ